MYCFAIIKNWLVRGPKFQFDMVFPLFLVQCAFVIFHAFLWFGGGAAFVSIALSRELSVTCVCVCVSGGGERLVGANIFDQAIDPIIADAPPPTARYLSLVRS